VVRAELELGTPGFQVRRPNHSVTLPLQRDVFGFTHFSVIALYDNLNPSFYLFPQHASVIRPDRTAVVDFVIRTAVSVPADMVSEGGSAISVLRVTMVSLIVSVSVLIKGVRVSTQNQSKFSLFVFSQPMWLICCCDNWFLECRTKKLVFFLC